MDNNDAIFFDYFNFTDNDNVKLSLAPKTKYEIIINPLYNTP